MNILTLHLGHNSAAFLAQNGVVIGAAQQERFDNIKNSSHFPGNAINWLLDIGKISCDQVDLVGVSGATPTSDVSLRLEALGLVQSKIKLLDRHLCHAYAPVAFFDEVTAPWLIFTADAEGDGISSSVNIWDGHKMERIATSPPESSLGYLYGITTAFMGMKMFEHEYKVMGLAAYAQQKDFMGIYDMIFKDVISLGENNPLVFKSHVPMTEFADYLKNKAQYCTNKETLAGALQYCVENLVLQWVKNAVKKTGIPRIMTGGGVFMNVKLNKLIRELPEVEEARFMPSCGDEASVFGAARALSPINPVNNLYLGPAYTNDEIKAFLNSHAERDKFTVTYQQDINGTIADLLADHKVVARFAGRGEFGARSLGNRAILAHPSDMKSFHTVNEQIKNRDPWMPFAPTILDVDTPHYISNPKNIDAPYMIDAFDTTPEGQKALCAAMHRGDKTVRPQILKREANPGYYDLIEKFKSKSGVGAVLNTSLNIHGYPLASSLEQAIFTMMRSDLRYMALESWLVEKKH